MLCPVSLLAMMSVPFQSTIPEPPREFRAAWVATVDNIDWPSKRTLTVAQQKAELLAILDRCQSLNFNAVVFQVRPSTDALYDSKLEPWSEYLTGAQGKPPSPYYDPLAFAIHEAHLRGIEVHAWFNPYRAWHPAAKGPVAPNHISKTKPQTVKQYGTYLWMDPGEPETITHSLSVVLDVVKRYDLDGMHIDDYFYPYPIKDDQGNEVDFPDDPSWKKYVASGGKLARDDWRRHNVDQFVEQIYKGIKGIKPWVKFGISPFGIYRPGNPPGITGFDQYAKLYADARKWLVEGWCDYYTPQLYWPIAQAGQSYPKLLTWWTENNPKGRHIWPGNYSSQLGAGKKEWSVRELLDQIDITRKTPGASGNVFFSMKTFMQDYQGIDGALRRGPYKDKALVPASPWLAKSLPEVPTLLSTFDRKGDEVRWAPRSDVRAWVVYEMRGNKWEVVAIQPGNVQAWKLKDEDPLGQGDPLNGVAVAAVDRVGQLSKPAYQLLVERDPGSKASRGAKRGGGGS